MSTKGHTVWRRQPLYGQIEKCLLLCVRVISRNLFKSSILIHENELTENVNEKMCQKAICECMQCRGTSTNEKLKKLTSYCIKLFKDIFERYKWASVTDVNS
jgi:hypothetical protein